MQYHIIKTVEDFEPDARKKKAVWDKVGPAALNFWPWNKGRKHPNVETRLLWSDAGLYGRFQVREKLVLAKRTEFQSSVCRDSCVEFFVSPDKEDYFNFEINCIGALLLGYGKSRENRIRVSMEDAKDIRISTTFPSGKIISEPSVCPKKGYVVEFFIPFSLFKAYFGGNAPKAGDVWKANFYKCADDLPEPHWGSWSPVDSPSPDFHRPEFFGEIIFDS